MDRIRLFGLLADGEFRNRASEVELAGPGVEVMLERVIR